jgi:Secretion system C-terminal sorting domain
MKKLFLTFLTLLSLSLFGQQTPVWYFGVNGGINFNSNGTTSTLAGSAVNSVEGTAIAADENGNVLFYTDGVDVWNGSNNTKVTTPTNKLLGNISATHAALIVPIKNTSCGKFLVFTTDEVPFDSPAAPAGLGVALVTVSGQTVTVDPAISVMNFSTRFTEKLAATSDGNNGWWVIAHDFGTISNGLIGNTFYKFHITNTTAFSGATSTAAIGTALNANFTTQAIGSPHSRTNFGELYNAQGQMKFTKTGSKLGLAISGSQVVETFLFNKTSGLLSLDKTINVTTPTPTIPVTANIYGFEFAPNNSNLIYVSEVYGVGTKRLIQYDISGTTPVANILATNTQAGGNTYSFGALQLGPNDKIYSSGPHVGTALSLTTLSVVNSPDNIGTACNYVANSVSIAGTVRIGLPTTILGPNLGLGCCSPLTPFPTSLYKSAKPINICLGSTGSYMFSSTVPASYTVTWSVSGAILQTASNNNSITVQTTNAVGTGTITAVITNNCGETKSYTVTVNTVDCCVPLAPFPATLDRTPAGGNVVCSTTTSTYTFSSAVPASYTVVWSVTGNLLITASNNNSVTVKASNTTSASGTINATITNNCNQSLPYTVSVVTGVPKESFNFVRFGTACFWHATVLNPVATSSYSWNGGADYGPVAFNLEQYGGINFGNVMTLTASNACGFKNTSKTFSISVAPPGCLNKMALGNTNPTLATISISPNPTNTDWNLVFEENSSNNLKLELLDMTGFVIKQFSYTDLKTNTVAISSEGLKPGIYQLKIYLSDRIEIKKLIKQ